MLNLTILYSDVNECLSSNGGCEQNCHNSEGSYECSCEDGYLLSGDNRTCLDIDECMTSPCDHECINVPGAFSCECREGYALDEDGASCNGMFTTELKFHEFLITQFAITLPTDIDECLNSNGGCDQNCLNLEGSYKCSCEEGFLLAGDNATCGDVDECLTNPCDHECINMPGAFRCECREGYVLDGDGLSCNGTTKLTFHEFFFTKQFYQILTNVYPLMVAVTRTASTLKADTNVLVKKVSCWQEITPLVKM